MEDLSATFNEIKSKLDELEERVRVVVLSGASEKSVGGLDELVEEAKQLVTMESEAIQQETGKYSFVVYIHVLLLESSIDSRLIIAILR